jgi:hypothetical protein
LTHHAGKTISQLTLARRGTRTMTTVIIGSGNMATAVGTRAAKHGHTIEPARTAFRSGRMFANPGRDRHTGCRNAQRTKERAPSRLRAARRLDLVSNHHIRAPILVTRYQINRPARQTCSALCGSRDRGGESREQIARQRGLEPPGYGHRAFVLVAHVRRGSEKPERPIVLASAGEEQDRPARRGLGLVPPAGGLSARVVD